MRRAGAAGGDAAGLAQLAQLARRSSSVSAALNRPARDLAAPLPNAVVARHAHSSSAREAVNMGLQGMAPSNRGEYVVTKLDDCAFLWKSVILMVS